MHISLASLPHLIHRWLRIERRSDTTRSRPVILSRQRIFILPTRFGVLFGVLLFVMLIGATNYNNSVGFLLTFLLGSTAMVSILHTYRNMARLQFRAGRGARIYCGEAASYVIHIDNQSGPRRHALSLALRGQKPVFTDIDSGSTTNIELRRPSERRGYLALGTILVSTTFPFGLFRAWSRISLYSQCLVYPRPDPVAGTPPATGHPGGNRNLNQMGNDDFIGYRDYHPSDSPRHVDWKAVARGKEMLTKLFADQECDEIWLKWKDTTGLDTEARLSQLCRWVIDAETASHRYGLRLPGLTIAANRGDAHKHRCLEALALFEP